MVIAKLYKLFVIINEFVKNYQKPINKKLN